MLTYCRLSVCLVAIAVSGFSQVKHWSGACDGSAVVGVGSGHFVSGSDEDNVIRLYSASSAKPLRSWDLNSFLATEMKKSGTPKEADLEAVAKVGNRLYWIGSHSRNKDGEVETSRQRFFATEVSGFGGAVQLKTVGQPFNGMLKALMQGPSVVATALREAEKRAHEKGGIDIEGMAATVSGTLLIGFRSPLVGQKAVIVELLNPKEVVETGAAPRFETPQLVSLLNRGVRDLLPSRDGKEMIILAGSAGVDGRFQLFHWKSGESSGRFAQPDLPAGNWEGMAWDPAGNLLLTADGGEVGSPACKTLPNPSDRQFGYVVGSK